MKLFKGIADKEISEIDHSYKTLGFYGYGIYLTPHYQEAKFYTVGFKQQAIILEYQLSAKLLEITLNDYYLGKLSPRLSQVLGQNQVPAPELIRQAVALGFDGIYFNGFFEGGFQVVLSNASGLKFVKSQCLVRKAASDFKS